MNLLKREIRKSVEEKKEAMVDECCKNPLKPNCRSHKIALYFQIGRHRFPICRQCWKEIAERNVEWDERGLKVEGKRVRVPRLRRKRTHRI